MIRIHGWINHVNVDLHFPSLQTTNHKKVLQTERHILPAGSFTSLISPT